MKKCTRCKTEKPIECFGKHSKNKDGLRDWCKQCVKEYSVEYRTKNHSVCIERHRKYNTEHKDEINQKWKEWYHSAGKESESERQKRFAKEHPDSYKQIHNKWRSKNPDKVRATANRYNERKRENGGFFTDDEWIALVNEFEFHCINPDCWKVLDIKYIQSDHVIPVSSGGGSFISNIQPLCATCNASKGTKTIDYRDEARRKLKRD